jgi:hypothetical protein
VADVLRLADAAERNTLDHLIQELTANETAGVRAFGLDWTRIQRAQADLAGTLYRRVSVFMPTSEEALVEARANVPPSTRMQNLHEP